MTSIKLSSNNQIVIPKEVRKKLGLKSGAILYLKSVKGKDVTLTTENPVDRYYGALKGIWTEDPVAYQRRLRAEWRHRS